MTRRANKVVPLRPTETASHTATVTSDQPGEIEIEVAGQPHRASLATHVPPVARGQRVLAVAPATGSEWLIVAAWPVPGETPPAEPVRLDPATGTLHVRAARIDLTAVASIELTCGETRIRLGVDGQVHINGKEILSSALGAHRIEGATVDIN